MNPYDNEDSYVKVLNKIEMAGGVGNVIRLCKPKFEIVKTADGARIQSSISIGALPRDLQDFIIQSLDGTKNLKHEQVNQGDRYGSKIVYRKNVSENYLDNKDQMVYARKFVGKLYLDGMNSYKNKMLEAVDKGTTMSAMEAEGKNDNPGIIKRFLDRVNEYTSNVLGA